MTAIQTTSRRRIDLRGAHRGGSVVITSLFKGGPLPPMDVQIVDKTPGRASELAELVRRYHHEATPLTADARCQTVRHDTAILVLCLDDASAQLDLLERASSRLIIVGQMLASQDAMILGGRVLGFGAVIPEGDNATRTSAIEVFRRINALSGGQRASSIEVTSPLLNTPQTDLCRQALYGDLISRAHSSLSGQEIAGGLRLATALPTPTMYAMEVRYRNGLTRVAMQAEARLSAGRAIVFIDADDLRWMYLVAPQACRTPLIVEMPGSDFDSITKRVALADAAILPSLSSTQVFVTD